MHPDLNKQMNIHLEYKRKMCINIKRNTAADVFAYIIDNGELIQEEVCQQMLYDFLKEKKLSPSKSIKEI